MQVKVVVSRSPGNVNGRYESPAGSGSRQVGVEESIKARKRVDGIWGCIGSRNGGAWHGRYRWW